MQTTYSAAPVIACAEDVALLQFLHDVPIQPIRRDLPPLSDNVSASALSLEQERQLTSILAALSAIQEDVNHVSAVAVCTTGQRLEVLVAINKATEEDGSQYIASIEEAFNRIFNVLRDTTNAYSTELEMKVFAEIVAACRERILSRLRFKKHKRGKLKQPLHERLQALVGATSVLEQTRTATFVGGTRKLIVALKSFSNHQVNSELLKVVEEAHSWNRLGDMTTLFQAVPTKVLGPTEYSDLRDIIRKVGQYRTAACRLYRLARDLEVLRSVKITPIRLDRSVFSRMDLLNYQPSLMSTIDRVKKGGAGAQVMRELCRYLGKDAVKAKRDFSDAVSRNLESSKVHAEVQILIHLKTTSEVVTSMPRIVQSNKKACYLCDQLFMGTDTLIIPKCHGKLYHGWRLPFLARVKTLQIQLNESLESQARQSITMILQKKAKIGYPCPYESSALSMSVPTVEEAEVAVERQSDGLLDTGNNPEIAYIRRADNQPHSEPQKRNHEDEDHAVTVSPTPSMSCLQPGHVSSAYQFGRSILQVEYSIGPNHTQPTKPLSYSVRSLNFDEISEVEAQGMIEILGCEAMEPGSEISLVKSRRYYFDLNGVIVELVLHN